MATSSRANRGPSSVESLSSVSPLLHDDDDDGGEPQSFDVSLGHDARPRRRSSGRSTRSVELGSHSTSPRGNNSDTSNNNNNNHNNNANNNNNPYSSVANNSSSNSDGEDVYATNSGSAKPKPVLTLPVPKRRSAWGDERASEAANSNSENTRTPPGDGHSHSDGCKSKAVSLQVPSGRNKNDATPGTMRSQRSAKSAMSTRSGHQIPAAYRRCITCLAILGHISSGLTIVIVNKMILHDHGLHTPALLSSTGALFTAAFTRLLVLCGKVHVRPILDKPWEFAVRRALPVGVFAAGSLCFGNMSYIYLDAGFVQMLKAGTPALLLLVLSLLRVEVVSASTASLALAMVFGSGLATLQQPNATAFGLGIQMISQLCEVLQCTATQIFLQHLGFEAWDVGYYLMPAIAACCLLPSLVFEWPNVIAERKVGVLFEQVPLLLLSGFIGIVVNFSNTFVIKFSSSLMAKLLVIARSSGLVIVFIINGEPFTWLQVVGYAIALSAFCGYSLVKAREMEVQAVEAEAKEAQELANFESDEDLLDEEDVSPTASSAWEDAKRVDLTGVMFWFATFVVMAVGYQAMVVGDVLTPCALFERELTAARYQSVSSIGTPPAPYLEPITAGTRERDWDAIDKRASSSMEHGDRLHTGGALSVESAAKVIYLEDGRFLLHNDGVAVLRERTPETVLASAWLLSSKQFGMVHISGLDNQGQVLWLSCSLSLVPDWGEACLFLMTSSSWDLWAEAEAGRYIFRQADPISELGRGSYLSANGDQLAWSKSPTALSVSNWLPELCSLQGMSQAPARYEDAVGEVTFTMTTFFHVYARSIMFRQAFASVLRHLREQETYVKEFLVINDWYEGSSLAFNGSFVGPNVEETRREMLSFFPGCQGLTSKEAKSLSPRSSKCNFIFKDKEERGQPKALNILLDLMVTKYWIHFEDDLVLYQDVYISRFLQPMYEDPDSCWALQKKQERVLELPPDFYEGMEEMMPLDGIDAVEGRRLSQKGCRQVAGVRMGGSRRQQQPALGSTQSYDIEHYTVPKVLFDLDYVKELLEHGGFDDDPFHGWGKYSETGAVDWPLFSLRPSLHNLTYIKSLEAPLFFDGVPGRFSENYNMTTWRDEGKTYHFHWNMELEFAVRWARGGATFATVSPGACMRDVSNGISSFERILEHR